jgi:hypothetical protein
MLETRISGQESKKIGDEIKLQLLALNQERKP